MAKVRFINTTTWTCPVGVTEIIVECWGGGGSGGRATGNPSAGGGGAGGCYARKTISVTPGTSYSVVVGAGGVNTGLADGQASYFNNTSTIVAQGGAAGANATTNLTNGLGGDNSLKINIGDVTYLGGNGADGVYTSGVFTGNGGGGGAGSTGDGNPASGRIGGDVKDFYGGAGANGPSANSTAGSTAPSFSSTGNFGGAGSGGKANTTTDRAGGNGERGMVIITYTAPDFFQLF